jgi:copper homeostasis protein
MLHGADGIVFGVLNSENRVDMARCREVVAMAPGRAVFHRAFDFISDQFRAMEELIDVGFTRILTSGGKQNASEGIQELSRLVRASRDRIEILPGGGIRPDNVEKLISETGCVQVHGSFRPGKSIRTSDGLAGRRGEGRATDARMVKEIRAILDRL